MLDISIHGGPFGGGKKPNLKTANLVAVKMLNNPFPSQNYVECDFIDSDNVQLIDYNGGVYTRKKVNFTTMAVTDYVSNDTQESVDYDASCIPFAGYFIILRNNTTFIDILNADKSLNRQIQLGTTVFTNRPTAKINFTKNKLVICCQVNSYNGYYDTYILNADLTVTTPTNKRTSQFTREYGLTEDNKLVGYYNGYIKVHDGTTGALLVNYNLDYNTNLSHYIITPWKDGKSYLMTHYDNTNYVERPKVITVDAANNITQSFAVNNTAGINMQGARQLFSKWGFSVLFVDKNTQNLLAYEMNDAKTKTINTVSTSGWATTNYGRTVTDRKGDTTKVYYGWAQYSAGYNNRFNLAKFITE